MIFSRGGRMKVWDSGWKRLSRGFQRGLRSVVAYASHFPAPTLHVIVPDALRHAFPLETECVVS